MSGLEASAGDVWLLRVLGTVSVLAALPSVLPVVLFMSGSGLGAGFALLFVVPAGLWLLAVHSLWSTNRSAFRSGGRIRRRLGGVHRRYRVLAVVAILVEAGTAGGLAVALCSVWGLVDVGRPVDPGTIAFNGLWLTAAVAMAARMMSHLDCGEWRVSDPDGTSTSDPLSRKRIG